MSVCICISPVMNITLLLICFLVFNNLSYFEAQLVPAMYVFGDSLVDVGNNNYLKISLAKANFPHNGIDFPGGKPTGRFCNGKNTADFLAEKVGLSTSPPAYLSNNNGDFFKGVSFASGGAGILNGTDDLFRQSIPLIKQVELYRMVYEKLVQQLGSASAADHLSKSLFPVVIGSNDLLSYFRSGSRLSKKSTPQQYVDLMLSTLQSSLKRLHNFGARKFIITGTGLIGCCPKQRTETKNEECNEQANYWSNKYNQALKPMLQGLKSELSDINYSYFDSYSAFLSLNQKPADYGFKENKAACCGLGKLKAEIPCVPVSTYCSNRSDHVFWDLYHPTEAAARLLADLIFSGSQQFVFPMNLKQLLVHF